ncbi:MAG: cob(I)yrinic acid a,c-diamide adenosyltransferase [Thermodesulfobacteriota bacterium]|nr:cob(I)yrinic acid a,c-diamide adenosyltransferase [Thermodesulfobacteriota bacterium]
MDKGYIHLYTGDGKGKTTAALGLALRAAGHGKRVFIGQFMKGQYYGELTSLKFVPGIDIEQFGDEGCIRKEEVTSLHREHARNGLKRICQVMESGEYQIVIMDEISVTIWFELVTTNDVLKVIKKKPFDTELILTGRRAPKEFFDAADLVTEMKEIKHYYNIHGILARDGIER